MSTIVASLTAAILGSIALAIQTINQETEAVAAATGRRFELCIAHVASIPLSIFRLGWNAAFR